MGFQEVLSLGLIVGHMLASALGPPTDTIQELRLVSATSVILHLGHQASFYRTSLTA